MANWLVLVEVLIIMIEVVGLVVRLMFVLGELVLGEGLVLRFLVMMLGDVLVKVGWLVLRLVVGVVLFEMRGLVLRLVFRVVLFEVRRLVLRLVFRVVLFEMRRLVLGVVMRIVLREFGCLMDRFGVVVRIMHRVMRFLVLRLLVVFVLLVVVVRIVLVRRKRRCYRKRRRYRRRRWRLGRRRCRCTWCSDDGYSKESKEGGFKEHR